MTAEPSASRASTPPRDPGGRYDVVIVGAGLAGLTLARHLLLDTERRILVLERRSELPPRRQKVGESTVQLAGFYLAKVLDLEQHLLRDQLMKYNLRFYWPTPGRPNDAFEDYGQGYIRAFSNVASYQLDRNRLEGELLRLVSASPRCDVVTGAREIETDLAERETDHAVAFSAAGARRRVAARWVVDTTGRGRLLARRRKLARANGIRHGAFFWWVDGQVDIERLTGLDRKARRTHPHRAATGHLPFWLATNHFMGEGFWFWVIPLRGKTSLGLVYDPRRVPHEEVFSVEKATAWVCERFPLFARDLPHRTVLDRGGYRDFSHDCAQTLDPGRWALAGEAGRFSDPLYSPGSDLIAIYNTLIVDAVETGDADELAAKCRAYEQLMRVVYAAYEPSYATSYDALGDPEAFALKYTWELAVYFGFYVFPFLNDLFTERRFLPAYFRTFARLGPVNAALQRFLSGYFQWKKRRPAAEGPPPLFDFTRLAPLQRSEATFYRVGVSVAEARRVLTGQLANLEELARFIVCHVAARVLERPGALTDGGFARAIDPARVEFDPERLAELYATHADPAAPTPWTFDPRVLETFGPYAGRDRPPRGAGAEAPPIGADGGPARAAFPTHPEATG